MQFNAKARNIRFSPYKLRPLADVIRGKNAAYALHWLQTTPIKRAEPLYKLVHSAVSNALNKQNELKPDQLQIQEIRVDEGPIYRYFKTGAMGRANIQRKRFSHISVVLKPLDLKNKEAHGGTKG